MFFSIFLELKQGSFYIIDYWFAFSVDIGLNIHFLIIRCLSHLGLVVFGLDVINEVVQRAKILDIYADKGLDSGLGFVIYKKVFFYLLIQQVDKIHFSWEFGVIFFGNYDMLCSDVYRVRLAAWDGSHFSML